MRLDKGIMLAVLTLLGLGLVQVYSASYIFAAEARGDGMFFFKRQLLFAALGVVVMVGTSLLPAKWIQKYGWGLWFFAGIGIALTLVPGLGVSAGGAVRWVNLPGNFVFEPSELLKVSLALMIATMIARDQRTFGVAEFPFRALALLLPIVLLLKQKDFGSFAICLMVLFSIAFAYGLKYGYVVISFLASLPLFYYLVMRVPYRRARVIAFLDPWSDPAQNGFQVIQSMLTFQSGGLTGVGLGQGQGKLFFLPEAHTDFTLAVLGEEMGYLGFIFVLALYGYLVFRGLQLAARSENRFRQTVALSLTMTFALTVFINIGVALGMLPTKGLTLPFLSYGGSSVITNCLLFGILLNIEGEERDRVPLSHRMGKFARRRG